MLKKIGIGIDSYCYHRFFGEVYPGQKAPQKNMTMEDFLCRAKELEVDGVSLESCFFPSFDSGYLKDLKAQLDDLGLERVYAWGHPDGLERGKSEAAFKDMISQIPNAGAIGAKVMRVTGSSLMFRHEPHGPQIEVFATHIKDLTPNPQARPTDWFFFSGVPVGRGLIDNKKLAELLCENNYEGFLAVEIDHPHPDWYGCEDEAVGVSVKALRDISDSLAA
jgi:sugar phosphate isomerase/epimerase